MSDAPTTTAPDPSTSGTPAPDPHTDPRADEINSTVRYTMYSVFACTGPVGDAETARKEVDAIVEDLAEQGLVVRGWYDVAGMRADADVMLWWHAPRVETLQEAYRRLRRTSFGAVLSPVWSSVGLHRPAEFNRGHIPAFMAGEEPRRFMNVYPFVRSYDWYLLPDDERRTMLKDHGMAALPYPDVRANTVSAFALGDYEWLLAFEADELHRIVDLMRDLRATEARRHVREELPFYTGRRTPLRELIDGLG